MFIHSSTRQSDLVICLESVRACDCSGDRGVQVLTLALFASMKKQAETLFRLIDCERKLLFGLKKQEKKSRGCPRTSIQQAHVCFS